jgi:hypothetical protein
VTLRPTRKGKTPTGARKDAGISGRRRRDLIDAQIIPHSAPRA